MADRYKYTGAEHTAEDGTVVRQGEEFTPTASDLRGTEDLWEPVEGSSQVSGADIGLRSLEMTDAALELALEVGLEVEDFEAIEPEGASGQYLKSQVEGLVD